MGLDMYWFGEHRNKPPLVSLSEETLRKLQAVLIALETAGIALDPYGTSRLSPAHAKLLVAEIEKIDKRKFSRAVTGEVSALAVMLRLAAVEKRWIVAEGD